MGIVVEVLPVNRFKTKEVIRLLSRTKGKPVPPRTFRRWCKVLEIERDDQGFFWGSDVDLLRSLVKWLNRGGKTFTGFREWYEQRQALKPETQTTIDVHTIEEGKDA